MLAACRAVSGFRSGDCCTHLGHFHVHSMKTGAVKNITMGLPVSFINIESDVNVVDPVMLAVTPIPLILAAFWACYLPASRAASVDPTVALRCE